EFSVARYNSDGSLDTSFGPNNSGFVKLDLGDNYHWIARHLAVLPGGKILLAGTREDLHDTVEDFGLVQLNPDGSLDTSFGPPDHPGFVFTDLGQFDDVGDLAVQHDGKILVGGYSAESRPSQANGPSRFALVRYNPDGTLDPSFDDGGKGHVTTSFNDRRYNYDIDARAMGVGLEPGGQIVLAGTAAHQDPQTGSWSDDEALARYEGDSANQPPVIDTIPDQSVNEGSTLTVAVHATDPNPGQTLTYSLAPGAPARATIDAATGVFTWTPDDGPATASVTVRATDNGSPARSTTQSFGITVNNVAPTASLTGLPATGHSPEGTAISLGSSVTDPSSADTVAGFSYAWSVTKNGAAFASGTSSGFSFTPDDNGTYVVSLTATDKDGGASQPATATLTVDNVAPTAGVSGPSDGVRGQARTFTLTASDPSAADQAAGFTFS